MLTIDKTNLERHHPPRTFSDRVAYRAVGMLRFVASGLFGRRYRHRTIVLETIAAVPGMVAATLLHLKCLRRMIDDRGWIRTLLNEAETQRAHLMVFVAIDRPSLLERLSVLLAQGFFYNAHFLIYLFSPRTAHRIAGYFAEDAVRGYGQYLEEIHEGRQENPPAPALAIAYWNLQPDARLADVIRAMQEDEAIHRDINHSFADALESGRDLPGPPRI
ncbi:MAG: oxidase [Rhizobiales bacterium 65-79]|jgi:ubiquinol oxidase|nr:alternative oxidase [Hyphomicrobiales bacterium]OJU01760.1 MAG: oxidase [Rhizobiales bacterium 65-79]